MWLVQFCVYNDHPRDPKIVAVVDRWSLLRGMDVYVIKNLIGTSLGQPVVDRWSLFGGGR